MNGWSSKSGITHDLHNERTKLLATFFNYVVTGFMVVGFITPLVGQQLATAGRFLLIMVWLIFAAGFQQDARLILGGIKS